MRALVNVGTNLDAYTNVPANVILDKWFPQPSVIPQVDAVIHHGGNNTSPSVSTSADLRSSCRTSGTDTTTLRAFTRLGTIKMHRNRWTLDDLGRNMQTILTDASMKQRLVATSAQMRKQAGPSKAARLLDELLQEHLA